MASGVSMFQFNCRSTKHSKNTAQVSCKYQHFHGNKFWLKILHSSFLFVWMYSILFSRCQCTFSYETSCMYIAIFIHHLYSTRQTCRLENCWKTSDKLTKKEIWKVFKLDFSRYKQKLNNLHSRFCCCHFLFYMLR